MKIEYYFVLNQLDQVFVVIDLAEGLVCEDVQFWVVLLEFWVKVFFLKGDVGFVLIEMCELGCRYNVFQYLSKQLCVEEMVVIYELEIFKN